MINIDPNKIGSALYFILTKKEEYNKYSTIYSTNSKLGQSQVPNLIIDVYNKYFKLQVILDNSRFKSDVFILQSGDIIKTGSGNTYLITQSEGSIGTWPRLTDLDSLELNSTIKQYSVVRPNFDNIKGSLLDSLQNIGKEILASSTDTNKLLEQIPETLANIKNINSADNVDFYSLGDGALQIGDLIFIVDPTQLAFNTQNGYQYFPTLRTQGNPKIPTVQQVKNLSINLIFPNEDSINYQLLNLYAMFRRTPFVNIRNKDICAFFKDICFMEEWLPAALESIQIQSVNGFPNTLQASITILPFDYRMMSDGFQVLLSMEDVERQQSILYRNQELDRLISKSEAKLDEQSVSQEKFIDILVHDIDKSPDFRNSLPFRAFYQSLIADRKFITDGVGKILSTSKKSSYDITWFRPQNKDNLLNEYKAISNNKSISLNYNYISKDFQTFSKILSDERTDKQVRLLTQLNNFYISIRTKDDLIKEMVTFFSRKEDFYNITEGKFQELRNNIVPTLLRRFGITLEQDNEAIKNWWDLLVQGISLKLGVVKDLTLVSNIGNNLNDFFGDKFSVDSTDVLGFLNEVTYTDKDTFAIGTFQWGIKKIWDWLDKGTVEEKTNKKKNFTAFLGELRSSITKEISSETLIVNPQENGELFSLARIPMSSESIEIDNINNIIIGWSIVFSNKFIPITLQAYKYPYYQHIGSEDPAMSLNITSINNKSNDLKSQLSLLSERLHESAKVVTLNAPELITYLDPRLTIDAGSNNIFNSFGVKKVVFDSFNSVNIEGQPNCWNIAVNFTQSNFTIADYHGVSHVPSSEIVIQELAKLVASIEKVNDNYVVMDYKTKDGTLLNLYDIIKIRFLAWSVSNTDQQYNIIEYIKQVKLGRLEHSNTGTIGGEIADKYLQEFYNSIGSLENYAPSQVLSTNNFKIREVNSTKTKAIQDLLVDNPTFKKILEFIFVKTNEMFKVKSNIIRSLVFNDHTWFQTYQDRYFIRYKANSISATITALFDTIELETRSSITSRLSPVFNSIEESFSSSVSIDFADKILRDPVVYNKIIIPEIIGETQFNNIQKYKNQARVNCYNDFDIPTFSDTVVLGPDFYLYNNIMDISESRYYISESLKRYAKIGKLGAMMSLVESTDALTKYDQIISQLESIEPEVKNAVATSLADDIPGYTSSSNIQELIAQLKNIQNQISLCNNNLDEIFSISQENQQILDKFKNDYENNLYPGMKKPEFEIAYKIIEAKINKIKTGVTVENLDFKKINLIYSARTMTMLEIFEVYSVLNNYILDKISSKNNLIQSKTTKFDDQGRTKSSSEKDIADKLYNYIRFILINNKNITTSSLESGGTFSNDESIEKSLKSELKKQYSAGGIADSVNNKSLSLPSLQNIQNYLFNKIGFYIRLNSFIIEYGKSNSIGKIDLTNLPELSYLDFWNFRAIEENERKLNIIKEFTENQELKKDTTIKMYPTFKLFFVEEDKNFITHSFDDYYTQNAIQSIEIVNSKNSASKTAIIRLSNITNSLTDKMSLLRESEDLYGYSLDNNSKSKNLFLGTLDIKPGTQIIIKMGYAPYDNLLTTKFHGRIIEMNNGSIVEMICQDFGSQLNHKIISEKFGVTSTVKDYGDIASATLDMIPGLEKLGKESKFNVVNTNNLTGRNLRNIGSNFGDRYLMSNLFGSLSALNAVKDNPRDENIYLNYSAVNSIYHKPTFDWLIYDQTVWSVLQELCLYNRDKITTIRTYNEDSLSNNNDLRETIVIGDKAGYYKCTDSFSLSSLNIKDVDKFANSWDQIKSNILNSSTKSYWETTKSVNILGQSSVVYQKLSKNGYQLYSLVQNKLNSLILIYHLLDNYKLNSSTFLVDQLFTSLTDNKFFKDDFKELIYNIYNFNKNYYINENELYSTTFESFTKNVLEFEKIINGLRKYIKDVPFNKELYYNVKDNSDNIDQKYRNDPQYKKIQRHHLITDSSDIIENNISLNSNFSNVVNVYYTNEPNLNTASLDSLSPDKIKNSVNMWTVKAFGDQKDEFSRILNSYQKNIDTNWFDIRNSIKGFYGKYQRIKGKDFLKQYKSVQTFDIPRWDLFPSFVIVGVRLLQQQVEKMYQGTIEIVGNPRIQPYDILHIQDYTNDMHGVVEVEEVIDSFTPERGYRTIITPNLITYDRDPMQLQDIQIINQIYDFSTTRRNVSTFSNLAFGGLFGVGAILSFMNPTVIGKVAGAGMALASAGFLYNGIAGAVIKQQKFLYDQLGHILGRDCINFTSLLYHGMPYMTGFDGVDYTNLKTLMNHKVSDVKNPISRFLSFGDTFDANIITNWNPEEYGILQSIFGKLPITNDVVGYQTSSLRTGVLE